MLQYPQFDPIIISIGPLALRWYGMMYVIGMLGAWFLGRYRAKQQWRGWSAEQMDDLITWLILGVILGGRLGYCLFYDPGHYLTHPQDIIKIWHGGMSFHGGTLGVLIGAWLWGRKNGKTFLDVGDFISPLVPPGLLFGRLGNFINSELWGRTTDGWYGMVFPNGGALPRHPSQLYEAFLEGLVLFIICWVYSAKERKPGQVGGMFLFGYGAFRFIVEFAREPDAHLGFIAMGWLTMGQLLCVPMMLAGAWLLSGKAGRE